MLSNNKKYDRYKIAKNIILILPFFSLLVFMIDKLLVYFDLISSSWIDTLPYWIVLIMLIPILLFYCFDFILIKDIEEYSKKKKSNDKRMEN